MEITSPYGYKEITPLMQDQRVIPVAPDSVPAFAQKANSMPISLSEISEACHDYPLAFVAQQDQKTFAMVAILGIATDENLFVENGKWRKGAYLPAYVRRYPFCMTRVTLQGVQQSQRLICVEKDAISPDGVAFFESQGQPTPQWKGFVEFMNQYERDMEATFAFCGILRDFKLLEPMSMQATVGGENLTLTGMYRIDLKRMANLNSSEIKTLFKNGALAAIYHHFSSMNRFRLLLETKSQRMALAQAAPLTEAGEAAKQTAS